MRPGRITRRSQRGDEASSPQWAMLAVSLFALLLLGCQSDPAGSSDGAPSEKVIAAGRDLYQANCATCHGTSGEGQPGWKSPRADGTYLPPPHDSTGHTWHHSDRQLLDIIRRGGQAAYGSPGFTSGMPAWGDRLNDEEIAAVLAFIKTFWGPAERRSQQQMSAQDP